MSRAPEPGHGQEPQPAAAGGQAARAEASPRARRDGSAVPPGAGPGGRREDLAVDLSTPSRVHLVGVGGAGMSGLARLLLARGHAVSGSDRQESAVLAALRGLGADVRAGHDAARLGTPDLVAASSAIRADNPELAEARRRGLPLLRRAQLLALLMEGKVGLAVAGTHGKTTTTAMATAILREAGLDPSWAVGGDLQDGGANAGVGAGPHFVAEADESDGSFLELAPTVAVVTNVEADHLDHWGDLEAVREGFRRFVARLPAGGTAVLCADDQGALALAGAAPCPVVSYGLGADAEVRAEGLVAGGDGSRFEVVAGGERLGAVRLALPGRHVVQNALGAIAATRALGAPFAAARTALARFSGAARRFQLRASAAGVTVVDDYAHHPTEVAATLATARLGGWTRVVAVFQPHLYSRTRLFAREFGDALAAADVVLVTDVYAAREEPQPGVDGGLVAAAARQARPGLDCAYVPDRRDLAKHVAATVRPGDLVVTLGAGDITTLPDELADLLPGSPERSRSEAVAPRRDPGGPGGSRSEAVAPRRDGGAA